uniref:Legume+lectins+beta+domain+containing+protein n=1 Tax=Oryza glaberrima TaxID=4538 RepID=G8JBC9_ORYGL|nr:legume+lectins+beta+domain+containing+protein [Oryza glaberrima]
MSDHVGLSAHGMAFVVAASRDFSSALPSGYLGLLNVTSDGDTGNRLLAVELDTMQTTSSATLTTAMLESTSTASTLCAPTLPDTTTTTTTTMAFAT